LSATALTTLAGLLGARSQGTQRKRYIDDAKEDLHQRGRDVSPAAENRNGRNSSMQPHCQQLAGEDGREKEYPFARACSLLIDETFSKDECVSALDTGIMMKKTKRMSIDSRLSYLADVLINN